MVEKSWLGYEGVSGERFPFSPAATISKATAANRIHSRPTFLETFSETFFDLPQYLFK